MSGKEGGEGGGEREVGGGCGGFGGFRAWSPVE